MGTAVSDDISAAIFMERVESFCEMSTLHDITPRKTDKLIFTVLKI